MKQRAKIPLNNEREGNPLRIVANAAIATVTVGNGKMVPLVIVDTSGRPDVDEMVRLHEHLSPGDVQTQWATIKGADGTVALILDFKRPVEVVVIVDFRIAKHGVLVDMVLFSGGLYLRPGREGDRFIHNPESPRILVEVPDTGFRPIWERMFQKEVAREFRRRGLNRHLSKQAAMQSIKKWRQFEHTRFPFQN